MPGLDGKAAVVTGGSRGIGRAIVRRLAAEGATVVLSFVQQEAAAVAVAEEVRTAGGRAHLVRADMGVLDDVRRLFAEAERLAGGLDILVNNAATGRPSPIAEVTEEEFDRTFAVNAKGVFFALQEAARRMRDGGRIINISTANTVLPAPNNALYQGSKGAVEQFTRVASRELGRRGITVNTVSPAATDTDLLRRSNPPEVLERVPSMVPLGRLGRPEDIANVVAFLAGPDGGWVTGQNIFAGGGLP